MTSENTNPERDPLIALTSYFEVLFPGRSPVAEIHAGAVLSFLGQCDPEALAEALGPEAVAKMALTLDDERFLGVVEQRWPQEGWVYPDAGLSGDLDFQDPKDPRPVFAPPIKGGSSDG